MAGSSRLPGLLKGQTDKGCGAGRRVGQMAEGAQIPLIGLNPGSGSVGKWLCHPVTGHPNRFSSSRYNEQK